MNTVDCGAQFAMLRSIKLHGGNTVRNTIKAIKARKKGKYIYIYINSMKGKKKQRQRNKPKPCKIYQELLTRKTNRSHQK